MEGASSSIVVVRRFPLDRIFPRSVRLPHRRRAARALEGTAVWHRGAASRASRWMRGRVFSKAASLPPTVPCVLPSSAGRQGDRAAPAVRPRRAAGAPRRRSAAHRGGTAAGITFLLLVSPARRLRVLQTSVSPFRASTLTGTTPWRRALRRAHPFPQRVAANNHPRAANRRSTAAVRRMRCRRQILRLLVPCAVFPHRGILSIASMPPTDTFRTPHVLRPSLRAREPRPADGAAVDHPAAVFPPADQVAAPAVPASSRTGHLTILLSCRTAEEKASTPVQRTNTPMPPWLPSITHSGWTGRMSLGRSSRPSLRQRAAGHSTIIRYSSTGNASLRQRRAMLRCVSGAILRRNRATRISSPLPRRTSPAAALHHPEEGTSRAGNTA